MHRLLAGTGRLKRPCKAQQQCSIAAVQQCGSAANTPAVLSVSSLLSHAQAAGGHGAPEATLQEQRHCLQHSRLNMAALYSTDWLQELRALGEPADKSKSLQQCSNIAWLHKLLAHAQAAGWHGALEATLQNTVQQMYQRSLA
jgi:hypothetical protein